MIAGFKKFIMQGNVIDLAVGVVIGAAFGALVKQFTDSFIQPLIKAVSGGGVSGGTFTLRGQTFDVVSRNPHWGEDRVIYRAADGTLPTIAVGMTDMARSLPRYRRRPRRFRSPYRKGRYCCTAYRRRG